MVGFCVPGLLALFLTPADFFAGSFCSEPLGVFVSDRSVRLPARSYFSIVVFKFLILMLEEVGGDEAFLRRAGKHKLKISTGPCCCCCLCLPYVAITR